MLWSEDGSRVALVCPDTCFILRHDARAIADTQPDEDGFEAAFDFDAEVIDKVSSGLWIGETFVYVNHAQRLSMVVQGGAKQGDAAGDGGGGGAKQETLSHLDKAYHMLGYLQDNSRVYLLDREMNIVSYSIPAALISYQSAIMQKDFKGAEKFCRIFMQIFFKLQVFFLTRQLKIQKKVVAGLGAEIFSPDVHHTVMALKNAEVNIPQILSRKFVKSPQSPNSRPATTPRKSRVSSNTRAILRRR